MTNAKTGSVYTLTDPRDGAIRYVGKTIKPLAERLSGHLASPTNPAMQVWIGTLRVRQLVPVITQIASVPERQLGAEEERLIKKHVQDGHRLFNGPYFQQHLEDLIADKPTRPTRRQGIRNLVYAAMLSAYLWIIGFDLLIRREVLPRMSIDGALRLWHAYLAGPLLLVAVHSLVALAAWRLTVYYRAWRAATRPARIAAAAARALDAALPPRDS